MNSLPHTRGRRLKLLPQKRKVRLRGLNAASALLFARRARRFAAAFWLGVMLTFAGFVLALADDKKDEKKPEVKGTGLLVAPAGQKTALAVYGENLEPTVVSAEKSPLHVKLLEAKANDTNKDQLGGRKVALEIEAPADCKLGEYEVTLGNADGKSVKVPVEVVENNAAVPVKKPCDTFAKAMPLTGASVCIVGFVEPNAPQIFRFDAKAGQRVTATLIGRHFGYGLDAMLRLRDSRHHSLALSAGNPKRDREIRFQAPSDGTYYLELMEAEGRGGETFGYRLTLRVAP